MVRDGRACSIQYPLHCSRTTILHEPAISIESSRITSALTTFAIHKCGILEMYKPPSSCIESNTCTCRVREYLGFLENGSFIESLEWRR
ncbi:unnamed protein product [Albugo candida]|uniref:Uncharacterized protein n=1 Tax=Albugo candida TaxID=65357 RepID=A0A024G8R8_9STRA|nr:unnamed protein product [Albugo candida]|eukprot:CCI42905.1 unnamed protein product [Albugo candida]